MDLTLEFYSLTCLLGDARKQVLVQQGQQSTVCSIPYRAEAFTAPRLAVGEQRGVEALECTTHQLLTEISIHQLGFEKKERRKREREREGGREYVCVCVCVCVGVKVKKKPPLMSDARKGGSFFHNG